MNKFVVAPSAPEAAYQQRRLFWRGRIEELDRAHVIISNCRLIVAAAFAVLLWMAVVRGTASAVWPILLALTFGALVVVHARVLNRVDRARRAERMYTRGRTVCQVDGLAPAETAPVFSASIRTPGIWTSSVTGRSSSC